MTHLFERTALVLLAGTALTACGTPRYAVNPPVIQLPAAAAPAAPAPQQLASAAEDKAVDAPHPTPPVQSQALAPLPAAPKPALAEAAAEPPLLAFAPPAEDAFARARARGPAATYTVKRGDTLAEIADRLGTDIEDIAKANGLKRPYRLQPGQVLKNPKAPSAAAASKRTTARSSEAKTYTVRSGDTLYAIAQRNGTTVEALREANGLGRSSGLMPGRQLKLPGGEAEDRAEAAEDDVTPVERPRTSARRQQAERPAPTPTEVMELDGRTVTNREVTGRVVEISTPGKAYKVKKGDNLERVADRLGSDIAELAKLNKLKKPYRLRPGQTIRGPGSSAKAYVVGRGDTLAEIARRFNVTEAELRGANGLRRGASVAPGRKLRLPAGYRDRGPLTTTTRVPERSEPPPQTPALPSVPQPYQGTPRPPSSFDTPPPVGQILPPPRSAPRPPTVVMPDQPQPYRPVPGAPSASPPVSDAQISQMGRGVFAWPLQGQVISGFGSRGAGVRNDGLNIRANMGDPVRAAAAGDVVYAGDQVPGFGNLVLIKHADGWVTAYGHLSRVDVRMQQKVEQGQQIGQAGSSGGVSEPQLHFEIRYAPSPQERARPIDPALVLPR
jgi:murein DD-endopeptidase MepM/ murein hydrolase activator NlpD